MMDPREIERAIQKTKKLQQEKFEAAIFGTGEEIGPDFSMQLVHKDPKSGLFLPNSASSNSPWSAATTSTSTTPADAEEMLANVLKYARKLEREASVYRLKKRLKESGLTGNLNRLAEQLHLAGECFKRRISVWGRYYRLGVYSRSC